MKKMKIKRGEFGVKKYIILTGTIARMGGAQMYVNNKVQFVRKEGWKPFVFSGLKGPVLIEGLKQYEYGIMSDLDESPQFYSKENQSKIIERLVKMIKFTDADEVIIESNTSHFSYWGELLAKRLKCKHFVFLLDETFDLTSDQKKYFEFKFRRGELSVIKERSLQLLFGEKVDIERPEQYVLVAPCNNVVEDVEDNRFNNIPYKKFDHVICSLGRLNKNYIPVVVEGFEKFARGTTDKILYIFIGSQPEDYPVDIPYKIKETFQGMNNVTLLMPGYVFPIPRSIMKKIDLAIASSGSAAVLADEGVTTITMDGEDGQPIGVLGYDTQERLFRNQPQKYTLCELINEVIFNNYLSDYKYHIEESLDDEVYMEQHFAFIEKSEKNKEYYDISLLKNNQLKMIFKMLFINNFGVCNYRKLGKWKRRLQQRKSEDK